MFKNRVPVARLGAGAQPAGRQPDDRICGPKGQRFGLVVLLIKFRVFRVELRIRSQQFAELVGVVDGRLVPPGRVAESAGTS